MMDTTCTRCGKQLRPSKDGYGDSIHTCSPSQKQGMGEQKSQELIRQAMEREYVRDPSDPEDTTAPEFLPVQGRPYLDGRFTADELEAMAWCMRNDKWPVRT